MQQRTEHSKSLLRRLVDRQLYGHQPGASVNTLRKYYESLQPDTIVTNCDLPEAHVCRFSPDGQYLVCFGSAFQQLVVYRFTGPHRPVPSTCNERNSHTAGAATHPSASGSQTFQSGTTSQTPTAAQSGARLPRPASHPSQLALYQHGNSLPATGASVQSTALRRPSSDFRRVPSSTSLLIAEAAAAIEKPAQFKNFFKQVYRVSTCSGSSILAKDFALFPLPGSTRPLLLVASHTPLVDPARQQQQQQQVQGSSRPASAVGTSTLPYVERTTLHLVDLQTGKLLDSHSWDGDWIPLAGNAGVSLHGDLLAVTAVRSQEIHLIQVLLSGVLRPVLQLGRWCWEDDELLVQQAELAEERWQRQQQQQVAAMSEGDEGNQQPNLRLSVAGAKRLRDGDAHGHLETEAVVRRPTWNLPVQPSLMSPHTSSSAYSPALPHTAGGVAAVSAARPAPLGGVTANAAVGRQSLLGVQSPPRSHVGPWPAHMQAAQQQFTMHDGATLHAATDSHAMAVNSTSAFQALSLQGPGLPTPPAHLQSASPGLQVQQGAANAAAGTAGRALRRSMDPSSRRSLDPGRRSVDGGLRRSLDGVRHRLSSSGGSHQALPALAPVISEASDTDAAAAPSPLIGGLKQRLLAHYMRTCLHSASSSLGQDAPKAARAAAKRAAVRRFYAEFEALHNLVIWRAQLVQHELLLLDMGPATPADTTGAAAQATPGAAGAQGGGQGAAGQNPGAAMQQQQGQYIALYNWRAAKVRAFLPSTTDAAVKILLKYAHPMGSDATGYLWERFAHQGLHISVSQDLLQGLLPQQDTIRPLMPPTPPLPAMQCDVADSSFSALSAPAPVTTHAFDGTAAQLMVEEAIEDAFAHAHHAAVGIMSNTHVGGAAAAAAAETHTAPAVRGTPGTPLQGSSRGNSLDGHSIDARHRPVAMDHMGAMPQPSNALVAVQPGTRQLALASAAGRAMNASSVGGSPSAVMHSRATTGAQDRLAVVKRVLSLLPAGAQLVSPSPLLDNRLFLYDDKLLTPVTRPRPILEPQHGTIRFYLNSRPEQVAFKLEPGALEGGGVAVPMGRQPRHVMTVLFHPVLPFIMIVGASMMGCQTSLSLHYRS